MVSRSEKKIKTGQRGAGYHANAWQRTPQGSTLIGICVEIGPNLLVC